MVVGKSKYFFVSLSLMKRVLLILLFSLLPLYSQGQGSQAPPTREWCEWAFWQLPDHRHFSEVAPEAFSEEFYRLLIIAYEAKADKPDEWLFLTHWYIDEVKPSLDNKVVAALSFQVDSIKESQGIVQYTITVPGRFPLNSRRFNYSMDIVFENGAWRINDWTDLNREWAESMRFLIDDFLYYRNELNSRGNHGEQLP